MRACRFVFLLLFVSSLASAQQISDFERGFLAGQASCNQVQKLSKSVINRSCFCQTSGETTERLYQVIRYSDGTQDSQELGVYPSDGYDMWKTSCSEAKAKTASCNQ